MTRSTLLLTALLAGLASACTDSSSVGPGDAGWRPWPPITSSPFHEDLPGNATDATVLQVGDTVYFFGGRGPDGRAVKDVRAYDLARRTLIPRSPMPTARYLPAAVRLRDSIYVIGGRDAGAEPAIDPIHRTVERYDPVTDSWTTLPRVDHEAFDGSDATLIAVAGNSIHAVSTIRTTDQATLVSSRDGIDWTSRELPIDASIDPTLMSDGTRLYLITDQSTTTWSMFSFDTRTGAPSYEAPPLNELRGEWNRWVHYNGAIIKINGFGYGPNGISVYDVGEGSWVWQDAPWRTKDNRRITPIVADDERGLLYFFAPPHLRVGFHYEVATSRFFDQP